VTLSALVRYIGSVDDDTISTDGEDPANLVVPTISEEWYLDLSASVLVDDHLSVNFGVKNVLDTKPTALGDQQSQANTFPEVYDVIGPRVFLSATYKFN
jgi:outer membrane receptor protein involved in Fe transport